MHSQKLVSQAFKLLSYLKMCMISQASAARAAQTRMLTACHHQRCWQSTSAERQEPCSGTPPVSELLSIRSQVPSEQ